MNRKYVLIAVLSIALFCLSFLLRKQFFTQGKVPEISGKAEKTTIRLKQKLIDIGDIDLKAGKVRTGFVIYNTGPNNLVVYDVKPDCKCTVGNFDKDKIVPVNDSTLIFLEYKPSYPGVFQVSAVVDLNVESSPLLVVRGNVLP